MVRLDTFQPDALRSLRRARRLTQGDLATQVGTTDRAVRRWESGAAAPDADLLPRLAAALLCRPEQLLAPVAVDTLRTLRQRRGLTQADVADRLGLHQSTYSRLERGVLPLDPHVAVALARTFGVARRAIEAAHAVSSSS